MKAAYIFVPFAAWLVCVLVAPVSVAIPTVAYTGYLVGTAVGYVMGLKDKEQILADAYGTQWRADLARGRAARHHEDVVEATPWN